MSLTNTTSQITEPVTAAELETHARIPAGEKEYLAALVSASRIMAEHQIGQYIAEQQLTWTTNHFEDGLLLPVYPVTSVESITYLDTEAAMQTLSTDVYKLVVDKMQARLYLKPDQDWPDLQDDARDRITVVIKVGMDPVPAAIKQAIMLIAATAYENRQDEVVGESGHIKIDMASSFFLRPYKRYEIG